MIRSKIKMGLLWAWLALVLYVWPGAIGPAHAQGSRKDDIVFNSRGIPLAGATVRVCAMPASGQPCTPLALIYSDPALTQALANPTTTDGLGNYSFYAAPGKYEIEVSSPGITTKQLPNVILPNDPSSPTFTGGISAFSLTLSGNLTVNGSTTVVGNLASGTLNLSNQSTPPGAASSGTVNLYTKTADKRLYYKDDTGTEIGPVLPGAATNVTNTFTASQNFDADTAFKGPNPWTDVRRYGVRSTVTNTIPMIPGITANCSNGQATVTLSSASTFQNGDGVNLFGCGSAHSMTTPSGVTVTPSLWAGPGLVVNAPAGSTTWSYQVAAENSSGGLTAASASVSTTTGAATLGRNVVIVTSSSQTGTTVTVTTASAHGLAVGAVAHVFQTSVGAQFSGWFTVVTVPNNTTFTYQTNADVGSATVASAGGKVEWWNINRVSWTYVNSQGIVDYAVWGRSGSLTLLGLSQPTFSNYGANNNFFDDWGSPFNDNQTLPYWLPNTPPASAASNNLITTISSGAGTTTLTLAANAGTSVFGATILFDNGPNFVTAANAARFTTGGLLTIPYGTFVINSYTQLTSGITVSQQGQLFLNGTLNIGSGTKWYGDLLQGSYGGISPSFAYAAQAPVTVNRAHPGMLVSGVSTNYLRGVQFSMNANGLGLTVGGLSGIPGIQIEWSNFTFPTNDFIGVGVHIQGDPTSTSGSISNTSHNWLTLTAPQSSNSPVPLWWCEGCGVTELYHVSLSGRGLAYKGNQFVLKTGYIQAGSGPFLEDIGNGQGASGGGGPRHLENIVLDTHANSAYAMMPYPSIPGVGTIPATAVTALHAFNPSSDGTSVPGFYSAPPGPSFNNNPDTPTSGAGNVISGAFFGSNTVSVLNSSTKNGALGSLMPAPVISVTVGANGSCASNCVASGTYFYSALAVDILGNVSAPSSTVSATVNGTQAVTISETTVPAGQIGLDPGRGTAANNVLYALSLPFLLTNPSACQVTSYTDGTSQPSCFPSGYSVSGGFGGTGTQASVSSSGLTGAQVNLVTGGFKNVISGTFTANRTQTVPDVTGYLLVTGYLNSAYDNANRANGPIGSSWTVTNNGINIASNNFAGTVSNNNNVAYWSASPFSNVQFSQVTITALNGTTDFPGVTVLASGSGSSTQGYECVENTANIYIQKISGTSNTTLTSAATTGAPGDILRLEAATGGALTCYKNAVSTLTVTDTSYTSGSPGLFLFGTVPTAKNWSGGNLHPIAQLDTEQDWTKTQHFVQGIALGGASSESFNNNPRAEQNVFLPGALTSTWTGSTWTTDKAVTITRVQVQAKTAPSGCTTNAVVRLTDGTTPVNVTISAAANDSGAISQNYAASSSLTVGVQTAAAGCTTSPADANVTVQYRMQ